MTPARGRGPRGSVLVEFVLILPILLLLVIAAIDWGWYFVLRENAVHATREGARVGSVAPPGAAEADAVLAVQNYLRNALGAARVRDPEVATYEANYGHGPFSVISVRLVGYPAGSISGLRAWTHVPETIDTRADMRLENQPPANQP
jgi:hypothetical protein